MAVLVFDSSPLCAFARAHRLSVLDDLTAAHERVTTRAVLDELAAGESAYPALRDIRSLSWLKAIAVDDLEELRTLLQFTPFLKIAERRDLGEATVLAWAKVHDAVAILDDAVARGLAARADVKMRGTLGLIADGVRRRAIEIHDAVILIDLLRAAGAWLPCDGDTFPGWCRQHGLG